MNEFCLWDEETFLFLPSPEDPLPRRVTEFPFSSRNNQPHLIYANPRSRTAYRYTGSYPKLGNVFNHCYGEWGTKIESVGAWECNLEHPCFAKLNYKKHYCEYGAHILNAMDEKNVAKTLSAFMTSKFLLRKDK